MRSSPGQVPGSFGWNSKAGPRSGMAPRLGSASSGTPRSIQLRAQAAISFRKGRLPQSTLKPVEKIMKSKRIAPALVSTTISSPSIRGQAEQGGALPEEGVRMARDTQDAWRRGGGTCSRAI